MWRAGSWVAGACVLAVALVGCGGDRVAKEKTEDAVNQPGETRSSEAAEAGGDGFTPAAGGGDLTFQVVESAEPCTSEGEGQPPEPTAGGEGAATSETLPDVEGMTCYQLGPELADASIFAGAVVRPFDAPGGSWEVSLTLTEDGEELFRDIASTNVGQQLAVVSKGVVQSAPMLQESLLSGSLDEIVISGMFDETSARSLAAVIQNVDPEDVEMAAPAHDLPPSPLFPDP